MKYIQILLNLFLAYRRHRRDSKRVKAFRKIQEGNHPERVKRFNERNP